MEKSDKNLNDLPLNQKGYIKKINCTGDIQRRLLDLGFIEGSEISPVLVSPILDDPRAFFIRGTLIAIRKEDAKLITIN